MSAEARVQLLRFALEGERVRRAVSVLERESPRLSAALRRAIPFLSRRGLPVALASARAAPIGDLLEGVSRPIHATHFVAMPANARGALLLDAGAIAICLDGVLGGEGRAIPVLNPAGLTGPQTALVSGLASGVVSAFSDALFVSIGIRLECRTAGVEEATAQSAPIACILEFGTQPDVGRVMLLLPKEALLASSDQLERLPGPGGDPRLAAVLANVELDLVAELGRVRIRLRDLAALKVGDTLRLDASVNGTVSVRANEHELMRGKPTTQSGRLAVKIASLR
jgi:flagellar motor switch protein FliM